MRIIDLSHCLIPGKQRFKLEIKSYPVEEVIPNYKTPAGEWYIMEDLEMCTHVGTHVEAPYHALKDGPDISRIDPGRLMGAAAVVDFTDKKPNEPICFGEILRRGEHIQAGDIVLIKTGMSRFFGTSEYKRPYLEPEAIDLLVDRGIKCLGVDCSGIENRMSDSHEVNHRKLFSRGIPLIEDLNNLHKLKDHRVFFMAAPLPIVGLDASPLRPFAIEPYEYGRILADMFLNPENTWEL